MKSPRKHGGYTLPISKRQPQLPEPTHNKERATLNDAVAEALGVLVDYSKEVERRLVSTSTNSAATQLVDDDLLGEYRRVITVAGRVYRRWRKAQ